MDYLLGIERGPSSWRRGRGGLRSVAVLAAAGLALAGGGIAYADDVYNTLDSSIDAEAEILALNAGAAGSTHLAIQPKNGDGETGCNVKGDWSVTLNLVSSDPTVATVSPATVILPDCGVVPELTISALKAGTTYVSATVASTTSPGSFNTAPAAFRVDVTAPAPANTAPVLSISGVENGASYAKGAVPAATCQVTDPEDGNSSFPATLGAVSGPDGGYGVGTQEASCSYTDDGGITVASSVTYGITDATAPSISYTLDEAEPDGMNGWYTKAVTLKWTVTEGDSFSTLNKVGCSDVTVTLDQLPADYSCSASSSGGTSGTVTVPIKKDGTAPEASYADAKGTAGNGDWYTSDVLARFTATDATSGLATSSKEVPSNGEGPNVRVPSPAFTDNAGNSLPGGAISQSFKIDKTAPTVSYGSASPAANSEGWNNTAVEVTFSATDLVSGPLEATKKVTSSAEGAAVTVQSPEFADVAGNVRAAGAASATFKIDKTAPTVAFDSTMADSYFGSTPAAPGCSASDALSGLAGTCTVTGYSTSVGQHTLTATAKDLAGNTATITQDYEVRAWTLRGFYQPVDMSGVLNTVKGGSTVPAKFEVFAGEREITDPGVLGFSAAKIQCVTGAAEDAIETVVAGNTSLRYDATAGQFIYNWKTPTGAGNCYRLTMTAADGGTLFASFKLK